mgnify:CR=1 FL=1
MPTLTARDIAEEIGGRLVGAEDLIVSRVSGLDEAEEGAVSFVAYEKYRPKVFSSHATVVLVPPDFEEAPPEGRAWIVCEDPSGAFTKVIELFAPPPVKYTAGVHKTAVVDEAAQVGRDVHIGAQAVIERDAVVGDRSVVGAGTYVGPEAELGCDCRVYPNVTIRERCLLGNSVIIHSGTTIGSDGFGFIPGENGHTKIPQVGIVQIDDDVEIGAQCAIDRARFGKTWIQEGVKIDNLVQIAHNVIVGKFSFIVAQVGISGSTRVGQHVSLAGQAGVAGHLDVGDGSIVMGQSGVANDLPAGAKVVGMPAVSRRQFAKNQRNLERIDELKERVKELERQVADLANQQQVD